jgi:hypothetical protein
MSRKGKPNLKGKQEYPRKCEHCDYVSNNPSMFHYHKKIHNSIPQGQLCNQGCGFPAQYINTRGNFTCQSITQQCPNYIKASSNRVLEHWKRPESIKRKHETKNRFLKYCSGVPEVREKIKQTLKQKWGNLTPEQLKNYRHYARRIRSNAQVWAKKQGYILGQQTYHVDHKLSIRDAWKAGLSMEIVNHPANLQIIEAKMNSSKGAKSTITVEQLIELIRAS